MAQVNENERFVVKNGIKRVYICVTMIGQVVLSFLNRNRHVFMIIGQSISEKKPDIFGYILDFFLKCQSISAILNKIVPTSYPPIQNRPHINQNCPNIFFF